MKKLLTLALALFLAPAALGQSVSASQIKKKVNAGLVGDSANALAVAPYRGSSPPSSPVPGQLWQDTTTSAARLKFWNGSAWETSPNATIEVQATTASLPGSPYNGEIVWISGQGRAVVYDSSKTKWYYLDAIGREAAADYSIDTGGYEASTMTPGATSGSTASGGSMTSGTHLCAISVYNSTGGETMIGAPTSSLDTTTNKTANLSFFEGMSGVAGKRVWCTKANTTTPYFLVTTIDDNTTAAYAVTVADTSFLGNTPPDESFAGALPSGWVWYAPDRSYGGCGSTGSALMCVVLKTDTNTTTSKGVRLYYEIAGDPAAWRASWIIARLEGGFSGSSGWSYGNLPLATLSAAYTTVPITFEAGLRGTTLFPISISATPSVSSYFRNLNEAYQTASPGSISMQMYPPLLAAPLYVSAAGRLDGGEYSYRFGVSSNGKDFAPAPINTAASLAQRPFTSGFGTMTKLSYIGVALEAVYSNEMMTVIYKFTSFKWWNE